MAIKRAIPLLLLLVISDSFGQAPLPEPKSEHERRNLETFRLWVDEVWGNGRLELVADLVADQYVRHNPDGTRAVTPEEYVHEIRSYRERAPKFLANAIAIDGNLIWTRWSGRAMGPDGQEVMFRAMQIYRFENAKLAETWVLSAQGGNWQDNDWQGE